MNGLYLQLHAYMLRIAMPYGTLNSRQMRKLADIARKYDRGYGHFTTRQNLQFNWPALKDTPDILAELASVEMHAIQTSGNCIRNVTADHFAGVAADEIADPRPYAEILRQWSSQHPEFSFLPRKFKIAVNGGPHDRAAIQAHDIGLQIVRNDAGELGFTVYVGGGLGRTPLIGKQGARISARARSPRLLRTRFCASTISRAGATTSTRRASRSCCTKRASRACATRSRRNSPPTTAPASRCPPQRSRASAPISRRPRSRRRSRERARRAPARARTPSSRILPIQRDGAQDARLRRS